ncbi:MAG: hypothetical protein DRI94_11340 [Bacteroidetes bacterium]|nr:MAG: hypothetical protein DRI94_11340 [Bacteroidota bacterium]
MVRQTFRIVITVLIISGLFFYPNCKGEDSDKDTNADSLQIQNSDKTFKFKEKLFSIPSPFVASDLIKEISDDFNSDLLNPAENKINYTTTSDKALNLGVYTADLAYSNVYEQFSSTTKYIKVVRNLSSELQIMNSYTDKVLENFEKNLNDKDSLNKIFTNAYRETDLYLSENNRQEIADLVVTGAWIEGLFLMTQIAQEENNKELIDRIGEQKYSLQNLIILLNKHQQKNEQLKFLNNKLNELNREFSQIEIKYKYINQIVVPNERKSIILSETQIIITPELLKRITEKVKEIRKLIIK